MPECHVCLGTEFEELDGLFYCLVCQTQSQVIQTVELDETDAAVAAPAGVLREVEKKKSSDSKSVTEFPEKGRLWTVYEAYQIIIQGQVDALIVHGAQPDLKEAVLRLWAKYLSQLGVAFTDDIHLVAKNVEKGARHREKYMGNCQNPVITPVRLRRTTQQLNKYVMSRSATEKEEERLNASTVLAGETFYEGDNPLLGDDDNSRGSLASCSSWELEDEEQEGKEEEEEESGAAQNENEEDEEELGRKENHSGSSQNDEGKNQEMASCSWNARQHNKHMKIDLDGEVSVGGRQRKRKFINVSRIARQFEFMDLYKTVAFCYLGLLFVSPGITVSDIVRWVYEGSFPYLEVTSLLPSDMKLFAYDERLFKPRHMTSTGLRLVAGRVARFLGINQFPAFPTKYVISRYILQLDLPIEMIALVHNLCEKAPPDEAYARNAVYVTSQVSVKNFDAQCVAYIIVMLKLLFGINDSKERELSDYTRRMQNIFSLDKKLFEWDAWQVHANQKFLLKPQSPWNKSETPDLESTCKAFKSSKYEDRNFSSFHLYTKSKKKKAENYKKENRVLLKRPLDVLLYRWTQRDQRAPSLHQKMDIEADEESSDGGGESFLGNKTWTNDQTISGNRDMGARFQRSTLQHITQAKHFWLRQIPDTVLSIDHKRTERVTSSSETGTFSFGGERASKPQLAFSCDQVLQSETLQLDKECSKIFEGLEDLVSAHRQYSVYPRPDVYVPKRQKEAARADEYVKYSITYSWLLAVCSHLCCCPTEEVQDRVSAIERYLLLESEVV